jgi:hypothetical protein
MERASLQGRIIAGYMLRMKRLAAYIFSRVATQPCIRLALLLWGIPATPCFAGATGESVQCGTDCVNEVIIENR